MANESRDVSEKTFTSFNKSQSKAYAAARFDYSPLLYNTVLDHHKSTGGQLDVILDIGCGPGMAARGFAPHFTHAVGLDPSPNMIATARELSGPAIRFDVSSAEALGSNLNPAVAEQSVDLLVAANAAHWFDMPRFWAAAARVVKPGGTVALWTTGDGAIDPSMPNAEAIQDAIDRYVADHLEKHFEVGNFLTRNRYATLPMPWDAGVDGFDEGTSLRRNWELTERWVAAPQESSLDIFEMLMGSASPQIRWYEAHPGVKGTDGDVLKQVRKEIEQLLHEAGVEKGKEVIKGYPKGVLLMVKRK